MTTFISAIELWDGLGKDASTKVRAEIVGTGNGTLSSFSLDHDNVVSSSETLYTDGTVVPTSSYSLDLDDGEITGLTASSGSALTADYKYADIPDSHIQKILSRADEELTNSTGRPFALTTSTEYIDVEDSTQDEYFLGGYPVTTMSSLAYNTASLTDTPSWETKSEGLGEDYILNTKDKEVGRFRIIDNFPDKGKDRIKAVYVHGHTTIPDRVKELATLLATRQMINSAIYQTIFKGRDDSSPINLDAVEKRIEELTRKLKKIDIEKP